MKAISNKELIDMLEKRTESHLQYAVSVFQNLDESKLMKPSSSGGWSIAECLWHLNSYGDYYLPEIKRSLGNDSSVVDNPHFSSGWLGSYFTQLMEPKGSLKKMGAFKAHQPPAISGPHKVVAEFIQQQETLLQLLTEARKSNLNKRSIPISIMRWLKLKTGDVFQFVIAHNERHLQQAKRNL